MSLQPSPTEAEQNYLDWVVRERSAYEAYYNASSWPVRIFLESPENYYRRKISRLVEEGFIRWEILPPKLQTEIVPESTLSTGSKIALVLGSIAAIGAVTAIIIYRRRPK